MTIRLPHRTARSLAAAATLCMLACAHATTPPPAVSQSPAAGLLARFERKVDAFPIADSAGRPFAFPLLGGLDRPRPQLVDIDDDGDLDLFVQEYGGQMMFFERVVAADGRPARYVWRTDRWQDLDIGEWSRFVDVDGDGDQDLLAESPYSFVRWYRNDGGRTRASFTVAADTVKDADGRPVFADRQNIPQFTDLDCNGRLDLMLGRVDGTVTRYEMRALDPARGPLFGLVTERFEGIQIIGGDAVQSQPVQGNVPGNAPVTPVAPGPTRHGANTMAITDIDGDGDPDILWGDFFEPGLLLIRNTGTCPAPSMRETPTPFPVGSPLRTSGYNAPTVGDLDGDGDLDLLVGVLGGAYDPNRTSRDNLFHLEQTAPGRYAVRSNRFLDGLDVGNESSPALADLDGDGDLDLLVGEASGTVNYYRNDGTASAAKFSLVSDEWEGIQAGRRSAPRAVDLDADGDLDLVVGNESGKPLVYRNTGSAKAAALRREPASIDWPPLSAPAFGDLDGDGDPDALVGTASGGVIHLRNLAR